MAKPKLKTLKILLGFLIIILCILRFWNAQSWFSFNFDEEYQAFLAWSQVQNFHPIWIGVSASNIGFYLGPGVTYLNAFLFKISNGDLISLAIFSPMLGIATGLSIYYVVKKIFSPKAAIFSSLTYAISPLMNFYDRRFWNPSFVPFLTIWLLFSLYKSKDNTRWLILSSAIMAASLHVHLSLLVFWPIIIYLCLKYLKKINWKTWVLSILSYLVIISPLIVYDLVHNFDNILTPIRMLQTQGSVQITGQLSAHLISFWDSLSRFWYLHPFTSIQSEMGFIVQGTPTKSFTVLSLFSLAILIFIFFKTKSNIKYHLLLSTLLISLLSFIIFPGNILEYYLLSFFTLFSISAGIFFESINKKISWLLIVIFAVFTSITIFTCTQSKYGFLSRKERIQYISQEFQNKPYSVILGAKEGIPYSAYGGWCYLFGTIVGRPTSCPADESFGWIYSPSSNSENNEMVINLFRDLDIEND